MRVPFLLNSFLLSLVLATETPNDASQDSSASSSPKLPEFKSSSVKGVFVEQFIDGWDSRWVVSRATKDSGPDSTETMAYVGEWEVLEPTVFKGINGDKGLVVKNVAAHHAISSKFPAPLNNKGKTLVVQYEVKLQNGLECGGAYLKLLQDKAFSPKDFSNSSPYVIMFGPDRCGSTNKVHFIFRHKNPVTGVYEEKHLIDPPVASLSKTTSLYTLVVKPDQTYQIRIDGKNAKNGSLFEDFQPSVNPDKEIDDPDDKKPSDWVDDEKIPDPNAKKPDDWDEDAPFEIEDVDAKMPEDWLEDEPLTVTDPNVNKPDDWDDEEDGDWSPPTISNPKCKEVSGCGPWKRPMKRNPEYKGKWKAPLVDNPEYKGVWKPRKIANKGYFYDATPANFEPISAIGFEIWTMQNMILFDNIYVGHSLEDAEAFQKETFDIKIKGEEAAAELASKDEDQSSDEDSSISFKASPIGFIKHKYERFVKLAKEDPVTAIKAVPEISGGIGALAVSMLIFILMKLTGDGGKTATGKSTGKASKKSSEVEKESEGKTSEAVATGTEKSGSDVHKRSARTSGL